MTSFSLDTSFVLRILIHGAAREEGQTLVTFEKAAIKLPGALVLAGI